MTNFMEISVAHSKDLKSLPLQNSQTKNSGNYHRPWFVKSFRPDRILKNLVKEKTLMPNLIRFVGIMSSGSGITIGAPLGASPLM